MTTKVLARPISPDEAGVVIVEDNADNRFIVIELLRRIGVGYRQGVASGRQLFELIETWQQPVHLILLDLQMPQEDGYTIFAQIRATPRLQETRVVALSANVMTEEVTQTRLSGFNGFIGKPINYHRFPQQIARILAGEEVWEAR